jgi:hypothetical protein
MSATANLEIDRFQTYLRTVNCFADEANTVLLDVSGYTFTAQVRSYPGAAEVLHEIVIDVTQAAAGIIGIEIDLSDGALPAGHYWWDLRAIDPDSHADYWLRGTVKVSEPVTRPA